MHGSTLCCHLGLTDTLLEKSYITTRLIRENSETEKIGKVFKGQSGSHYSKATGINLLFLTSGEDGVAFVGRAAAGAGCPHWSDPWAHSGIKSEHREPPAVLFSIMHFAYSLLFLKMRISLWPDLCISLLSMGFHE